MHQSNQEQKMSEIAALKQKLKSLQVVDIIEDSFRNELIDICDCPIGNHAKCADIFFDLKKKVERGNSRDYYLDFVIKYFI